MFTDESIQPRNPTSPNRVMIVDGNKSRFTEIVEKLEKAGLEVYYTNDRKKLVDGAIKFSPDLVIMNLFLGTGTTLPTLREMRGILKKSRYLIVSRQMTKENIKEIVSNGANDCISDPFNPDTLFKRIQYQLQDRDFVKPDDIEKNQGDVTPFYNLTYEVQKIVSEVKDPHEAIHLALKRIQEVCRSNRVNVIRGNPSDGTGFVVATSDDAKFSNQDVDLERYPEVREVLMSDALLFVKDISQNPLTKGIQDAVKSIKIESILVLPVRYRAETFAALVVRFPLTTEGISPLMMKTLFFLGMMIGSKIAAKDFIRDFLESSKNSKKAA